MQGVTWVYGNYGQIKYRVRHFHGCAWRSGLSDCIPQPLVIAHHRDSLPLHNLETTMCTEWFGRWGSTGKFGAMRWRLILSLQQHFKPFFAFFSMLGKARREGEGLCFEGSLLLAAGGIRIWRRALVVSLVTTHSSESLEGLWQVLEQVVSCCLWEGQRLS